jgi:hypothetical protein
LGDDGVTRQYTRILVDDGELVWKHFLNF